jgi:hypothetical protein
VYREEKLGSEGAERERKRVRSVHLCGAPWCKHNFSLRRPPSKVSSSNTSTHDKRIEKLCQSNAFLRTSSMNIQQNGSNQCLNKRYPTPSPNAINATNNIQRTTGPYMHTYNNSSQHISQIRQSPQNIMNNTIFNRLPPLRRTRCARKRLNRRRRHFPRWRGACKGFGRGRRTRGSSPGFKGGEGI